MGFSEMICAGWLVVSVCYFRLGILQNICYTKGMKGFISLKSATCKEVKILTLTEFHRYQRLLDRVRSLHWLSKTLLLTDEADWILE